MQWIDGFGVVAIGPRELAFTQFLMGYRAIAVRFEGDDALSAASRLVEELVQEDS